ncbi:hypothetical protein ACIOGT_28160 [Streptomyces microflavus]|uniref:Uncharacterized protein n=1 Tax=Streptomyces microflavus DSM 40593 TaxID=1303692 RepID=N0CQ30_STRMI|nr:hypothetical protein SFUL_143 [Streptomyces microflavus DSM 40593]
MNRTRMTGAWLADLTEAFLCREEELLLGVLQQPDYPALVSCPICDEGPESVVSRVEDPTIDGRRVVLVDFKPCRHGIWVPADE